MLTLLREPAVVDQQRLWFAHAPPDSLQCASAHRIEHGLIGPWRVGDKVMQALMFRAHPGGRKLRGHRLHALTLDRQQQARTVASKRLDTIGVPKRLRDQRHVFFESR